MIETLAAVASGAAAILGYTRSRAFVRRRLAFVDAVHAAGTPLVVGGAAALAAAPVVWVVPFVGAGTALLVGAAVGAGVGAGARDLRRRRLPG
jgi:hypothetical protein